MKTKALLTIACCLSMAFIVSGCRNNKKKTGDPESSAKQTFIVEEIIEDEDVIDMDAGQGEAVLDGYKDGEARDVGLRTQEYAIRAEIQKIQEEARKNADEIVVGIAIDGSDSMIKLKRLENGDNLIFDYSGLERDKVGNWFAGDTVMVYLKEQKVMRVRLIGKVPREIH